MLAVVLLLDILPCHPLLFTLLISPTHVPLLFFFFFLMIRRPPISPLFPSPTLFRSAPPRHDPRGPGGARTAGAAAPIHRPARRLGGGARQDRREGRRPVGARPVATETRRPNRAGADRKSTRLNSSHSQISYAVFCLK